LIAYEKLSELSGYSRFDTFQAAHRNWVEDALASRKHERERQWTESIATGNKPFAKKFLSQLGSRAQGRKILEHGQVCQVREELGAYNALFDGEKGNIALENTHYWSEDA